MLNFPKKKILCSHTKWQKEGHVNTISCQLYQTFAIFNVKRSQFFHIHCQKMEV